MYWTGEALEVVYLTRSALRTLTNLIIPRSIETSWTKLTSFSGNFVCNTKRKNRKQTNRRNRKEEWEGACFWSVAKWRGLQAVSEWSWSEPKAFRKSGCAATKKALFLPLSTTISTYMNWSAFLFFAADQPNQHSLALRHTTENVTG